MSNAVFPHFAGLKWGISKTPTHRTTVRETPSGREYRTSYMSSPRYMYKLSYEVLRETPGFAELRQLIGFYNQRRGSLDTFLYTDPDDCEVTDQVFGVGNGSARQFQLVRNLGGSVEPVYDLNASEQLAEIKVNGVLRIKDTHYTISPTAMITFTTPPPAGQLLTWSGRYHWRVRFRQDQIEFAQFLEDLWEAKTVELITVKP